MGFPIDAAALGRHIERLTAHGPRHETNPSAVAAALAYISDSLTSYGHEVTREAYGAGAHEVNLLAEVTGAGPAIEVGAHWDSVERSPGADDNASGVAGLLALAKLLAADPPPIRVELAAYTLEEPPYFRTPSMGSAVHARALRDSGAAVRLMMSVEMIGTFSDAKGSQRYPTAVKKAIYPTTGNFVAVVGRRADVDSVREVAGALIAGSSVPVETIAAPASLSGIDFSDHLNFWAQGFPAVMVTDTAFLRNPRYHDPGDLPDTLDYRRMAEVVSGVHCAVQAVARR